MTSKKKTPVTVETAVITVEAAPAGYETGVAVRETVVGGLTTVGTGIADGASFVGTRIWNFGKGLFNVRPAH